MKKVIPFLFVFAGLISCEKKNILEELKDSSMYPTEVPFTEYAFTDNSCHWTAFKPNEVFIINSTEELLNYTTCTDSVHPQIDFYKYSLLLVRGVTTSAPVEMTEARLVQDSENKYVLYVKVQSGMSLTPSSWRKAIITQKLLKNTVISLDVEHINK